MISQSQVMAIGRHVATAIGGAAAFAVSLHFLSSGDADTIVKAVNQIATGFTSIVTGVLALVPIASGLWAAYSASPKAQIAAINNGDNGVKVVAATAPANTVTAPLK
jgi:hypothetical protein